MELMPVISNKVIPLSPESYQGSITLEKPQEKRNSQDTFKVDRKKHFIEANTIEVSMGHLKNECVTPVFSKDNEITISHPNFIETAYEAASKFFSGETILEPEIMVSHVVKGRRPEAIYKPVNELLDSDKTLYYERMAFFIEIPSVYEYINGQEVSLCISGVRAYNHENLYTKKSSEKFKISIGFMNKVCCNMCISTDGIISELKAMSCVDLYKGIMDLFINYNPARQMHLMNAFNDSMLSEHEFAQLIGKTRLYQYLPVKKKKSLPVLEFTDSHINMVSKAYYQDKDFCKHPITGYLSLWNLYNLFTSANKSSYIDNFLDRSLNATQLTEGIMKALSGDAEYKWFIE